MYILCDNLEKVLLEKNKIINTINPHSYCISKVDKKFKEALDFSDVLLPDGTGIVWAESFLRGKTIKKIAGYDLFIFFMNYLNDKKGSVFFLGSSNNTLKTIKHRALSDFVNIQVGYYSPPFKECFSKEDSEIMCYKVNQFQPDVLFIGMTAPKQEKWAHDFRDQLKVDKICSIGAVFDFYAGNIKRSSDFWINLGLEWLPRLIREPRRLFYRNFVSTPKFILEVLSFKLFGKGIL